jgi:hypothetical protein
VHFAIRSQDNAGNRSAISNLAAVSTSGDDTDDDGNAKNGKNRGCCGG